MDNRFSQGSKPDSWDSFTGRETAHAAVTLQQMAYEPNLMYQLERMKGLISRELQALQYVVHLLRCKIIEEVGGASLDDLSSLHPYTLMCIETHEG
ncbi:MAG: hypothetical protein PHZ00_00235 [Candidatus Peribacteraceae bacterium]|nr:hypothetical protein [Candidatus Peribacteraceae bacterium]